jgi:hypothetical protein
MRDKYRGDGASPLELASLIKKLDATHQRELIMAFGGVNREIVTNSGWTGIAFAVTFITETTPTTFTMNETTGTLSGVAYPAGLTLYGPITSITVPVDQHVLLYTL